MNRIYRLALSLFFCVVCGVAAFGVPAIPYPLEMRQPDGSSLMVMLQGDERMHYYETLDGYLLCRTEDKGFVYALEEKDGLMVPSDVVASNASVRSAAEWQFLAEHNHDVLRGRLEAQRLAKLPKVEKTPAMAGAFNPAVPQNPLPGLFSQEAPFPTKGSPKVLVILVNYTDVKFTHDPSHFRDMLCKENYKENDYTGSVYDYYSQQSMNVFTPQFDVLGPVNLPYSQAYYGGNDSKGNDLRPREMVVDALNLLDATVDFSQYDNNHDGVVDNIYLFYAGMGEASGGAANTVWPHSWELGQLSPELDGVVFNSYACSNEMNYDRSPAAIGTFCHEFGHVLGLPDLYATNYAHDIHPGAWDLLASGSYNNSSRTPPNLSSFERGALGWLQPTWLHFTGDYALESTIFKSNEAFLIATSNANEFFLLENRADWVGNWDSHVPGFGMLVWHIDFDQHVWDYNIVNNDAKHKHVDIVAAHGRPADMPGAGACFPGYNHFEFDATTTPALLSWKGENLGISLSDIMDDDYTEKISFHVEGLSKVDAVMNNGSSSYKLNGRTIEALSAIEIFNMSGLSQGRLSAGEVMQLAEGVYVVKAATQVSKIMIR